MSSSPCWEIVELRAVDKLLNKFIHVRKLTQNDLMNSEIKELKIVHSNKPTTNFWIAGHRNINDGWELFNPQVGKFKSCIAPKGLSWIKGITNNLIIAESVIDVISAKKLNNIEADLLSLNSTTMAKRAGEAILKRNYSYEKIILALDNDKSGEEAKNTLLSYLKNMGTIEVMKYPSNGKDPSSELMSRTFSF